VQLRRNLLVFGVCSALGVSVFAQTKAATLTDLPSAAQSSISAWLGRDISDYNATRVPGGFRAGDLQRRLTTDFAADGVSVHSGTATWKMRTAAYGRGHALQRAAEVLPQVDANRVEYRRRQLTEWYLNGPAGLEQGFTVSEPMGKANAGPLTLSLALTGNVQAVEDHGGLSLIGTDRTARLRYQGLAAYDASGQQLRAWLELKRKRLLLRVDDRGAHYPVVIDPWVQVAEVTADDGGNADEFGWSVGVSGSVVVVGAPFHNVGSNTAQGAAYVFVEASGGWANMTETAELTASDGSTNAYFGSSVAISGTTIVVGAGGTTISGNPRQGAAYVFVQPEGGWTSMTETAELIASDGYVGDDLGAAVSISGNTVVAGAP